MDDLDDLYDKLGDPAYAEEIRLQQRIAELENENRRLRAGIEEAKYTLSCPVSGSVYKAISILAALEGEQGE